MPEIQVYVDPDVKRTLFDRILPWRRRKRGALSMPFISFQEALDAKRRCITTPDSPLVITAIGKEHEPWLSDFDESKYMIDGTLEEGEGSEAAPITTNQ